MPTTGFLEYARAIAYALDATVGAGQANLTNLQVDHRSPFRGLISGLLVFEDGSELHFREFVDTTMDEPRVIYAYHYQDASGALVFRYDNAVHRPSLAQPEHKHTPADTVASMAPALAQIIDEILEMSNAAS
jgi:hypothetical protein